MKKKFLNFSTVLNSWKKIIVDLLFILQFVLLVHAAFITSSPNNTFLSTNKININSNWAVIGIISVLVHQRLSLEGIFIDIYLLFLKKKKILTLLIKFLNLFFFPKIKFNNSRHITSARSETSIVHSIFNVKLVGCLSCRHIQTNHSIPLGECCH